MSEVLDWLRERFDGDDLQMFVPMVGSLGQMMRAYGINDDDAPDWRQALMSNFGRRILTGEAALQDLDFPAVLDEIRSAMGLTTAQFTRQRKAFLLGLTAAMFWYSREHMAPVIHDRKAGKGLRKGRRKRETKTGTRREEIRGAVKNRLQQHPKDTLTYARRIVADEMGIHVDTVRRATAGLKKIGK